MKLSFGLHVRAEAALVLLVGDYYTTTMYICLEIVYLESEVVTMFVR